MTDKTHKFSRAHVYSEQCEQPGKVHWGITSAKGLSVPTVKEKKTNNTQ